MGQDPVDWHHLVAPDPGVSPPHRFSLAATDLPCMYGCVSVCASVCMGGWLLPQYWPIAFSATPRNSGHISSLFVSLPCPVVTSNSNQVAFKIKPSPPATVRRIPAQPKGKMRAKARALHAATLINLPTRAHTHTHTTSPVLSLSLSLSWVCPLSDD
jgi:hypothetical protein